MSLFQAGCCSGRIPVREPSLAPPERDPTRENGSRDGNRHFAYAREALPLTMTAAKYRFPIDLRTCRTLELGTIGPKQSMALIPESLRSAGPFYKLRCSIRSHQ